MGHFSSFGAVALFIASNACGAGPSTDGPGSGNASDQSRADALRGEWTMMKFLGGPPGVGQLTDSVHWNGGAGSRHLRIQRNRAGVPNDVVCEVDAPNDEAWNDFVAALADQELQEALSHPERMPPLVIDAGYFACSRGTTRIAVTEIVSGDSESARHTAALRRLATAYSRVHDEVVRLPPCALPPVVGSPPAPH